MKRKNFIKTIIGFLTFAPSTIISTFNKTNNAPHYYKKGDSQYNIYRKGFNRRINKFPAIIAVCSTTEQVAEAVKYARKHKLFITVKSGGHSFEGYSSNDNGMLIDCSNINHLSWVNKETVLLGPGILIKDLYDKILIKNRIIPAGSCGGVGMGGLTLGGGYGLFSRKYGLTCDSLEGVTIVDGTGNIRNSDSDKELLWACKGGGNTNFGVVTEMRFKTHPIVETMQCLRFTSRKITSVRAQNILKVWFQETKDLSPECFSAFVFNGRSVYILLTNLNNDLSNIEVIKTKLSSISDRTTVSHPLKIISAVKQFYGMKNPVFFKNSSVGLYNGYEDIKSIIPSVFDKIIKTPGIIYQVNTLGGNIINPTLESDSAFPHRNKKWLSELQCYWDLESKTVAKMKAFRETKGLFTSGQDAQYSNYPDDDLSHWQVAYYGKNYGRLESVKKKFDAEGWFRWNNSIKN